MAPVSARVSALGVVTAVGDSAKQTYTSVMAGINRYQQSEHINNQFEPIVMALLPDEVLPPLAPSIGDDKNITPRKARILQLADVALKQCLKSLPKNAVPVPLYFAGPETHPQMPLAVSDAFIGALKEQTGAPIDVISSRLFPHGRAAGIIALHAAMQELASGNSPYVLVGGADTFNDEDLLVQLMGEDRTLASGIMDGFAPGEGAAFLLLSAETTAGPALAKLMPPGAAEEPGHRYSNEPYLGEGLSKALSMALENVDEPVRTVYSSLNGENHGAKEWGVAYTRNTNAIHSEFELLHPADCFGDTGAAVGPILLALAAMGFQSGDLAEPALVWASSDGPKRSAVCVTSI